jgi:alpha-galactosidase
MAQVPKQITRSQEYDKESGRINNNLCEIVLSNADNILWTFHLKQGQDTLRINAPVFEVDGKKITAMVSTFNKKPTLQLRNGVTQYTFEGPIPTDPTIQLSIVFRVAPGNPIIRFQYSLHTTGNHMLTKSMGKDNFTYCATSLKNFTTVKEIRLSEFNDKYHAYTLEEASVDNRYFEDDFSAVGPMIVFSDAEEQFLLAYEHGSQLPNRFLEFQFHSLHNVSLQAVKSNYLNKQPLNNEHFYETLWFE